MAPDFAAESLRSVLRVTQTMNDWTTQNFDPSYNINADRLPGVISVRMKKSSSVAFRSVKADLTDSYLTKVLLWWCRLSTVPSMIDRATTASVAFLLQEPVRVGLVKLTKALSNRPIYYCQY